jgi:hypothetical protein
VKLSLVDRLLALEMMNDERRYVVRTFPEHPRAPQLGNNEMLAQHTAQHKISLRSSTASLLLILIEMNGWYNYFWMVDIYIFNILLSVMVQLCEEENDRSSNQQAKWKRSRQKSAETAISSLTT